MSLSDNLVVLLVGAVAKPTAEKLIPGFIDWLKNKFKRTKI
jgi:hypothetical protein